MSGYIGNILVPQATQTRDSFIATAGQTSFPTSGYTPNFLDVYLNGIKLHSSDFTATNGSDVVLATGAAVNDVVEVVAFNAFDIASGTFDDLTVNNNIVVSGTVDGRDIAADGTKLDGIESGATGDQTNAEIRAAVEAATDSNVFTDADHTKLNAIEASATADQTAAEIRTLVESATDSNVFTDADHTKLNGIEASATADQTKSDIDALNINADTLDGQHGSYYTGYADTAVANIVDSAPGTLDTLNELAAALGDDPNFATTTATNIATKLPLSGGTMTGNLSFNDTKKAIFGTGSDFRIYHDGNNSYIEDVGDGILSIDTNGSMIQLVSDGSGANGKMAEFIKDGAVKLYYDNNLKLATTATGIDVTGKVTSTGLIGNNTNFDIIQNTSDGSDNKRTRIGGGGDVVSSRGAMIEMSGNEHGNGGMLLLKSGHGGAYSQIRSYTSNTERMRIDSSGNLLVGKTSANTYNNTNGIELQASGLLTATRTGIAQILNREDSDGDIAVFRKDGSTVGSIGTANSGDLYIGNDDTTLLFAGGSDAILPRGTAGATRDAAISLGLSSHRFKDLYLSGFTRYNTEVYVGDGASISGSYAANDLLLHTDNNPIVFRPNGTEAMRIDSSGNVVIGANPSTSLGAGDNTAYIGADGEIQIRRAAGTGRNMMKFRNGSNHVGSITTDADKVSLLSLSGDLILDASGIINLDADNGGNINLKDGGTHYGTIQNENSDLRINSIIQDKDIIFRGNDGGTGINALTLDMSSGGRANFNNDISLNDGRVLRLGDGDDTSIYNDGSHFNIVNTTTNQDILFKGNDDGSNITALTLDMSDAGTAIFGGYAKFADNQRIILGSGNDLAIYHDGSNSHITNNTGVLNINGANLTGSSTALMGHGYINTHDGTNVYWHVGPNTTSTTNKVLNLRIIKSDGNYVTNTWSPSGLSVAGSVTASNGFYGDGSNLTGVGGSTTAGAVGTYALLWRPSSTTNNFGDTLAGSNLRVANTFHNGIYNNFGYGSTSVSGTWRCMGDTGAYNGSSNSNEIWLNSTIWVRIS